MRNYVVHNGTILNVDRVERILIEVHKHKEGDLYDITFRFSAEHLYKTEGLSREEAVTLISRTLKCEKAAADRYVSEAVVVTEYSD